jgi:hypothetical protein
VKRAFLKIISGVETLTRAVSELRSQKKLHIYNGNTLKISVFLRR